MDNVVPRNENGETKTRIEWLFDDIDKIRQCTSEINAKLDDVRMRLAAYDEKFAQNDKAHGENLKQHKEIEGRFDRWKNLATGVFLSATGTFIVAAFFHVFGK